MGFPQEDMVTSDNFPYQSDTEFSQCENSQRESFVSVSSADYSTLSIGPMGLTRSISAPPLYSSPIPIQCPKLTKSISAGNTEIRNDAVEEENLYSAKWKFSTGQTLELEEENLPSPLKTCKPADVGYFPMMEKHRPLYSIKSRFDFKKMENELSSSNLELKSSKETNNIDPQLTNEIKKNAGDYRVDQEKSSWQRGPSTYRWNQYYSEDYYNWNRASYDQYSYYQDNYYYPQRSYWHQDYQNYPQYGVNQHRQINPQWKAYSRHAAIIEDLKSRDHKSLKELVDHELLLKIIKCSEGSRYIQQCMELATAKEKRSAFDVLCSEIKALCTDPFANYVIQKFFDQDNAEHRPYIIRKLMGNVLHLSLDMYGCRVIQKAIDCASMDAFIIMVKELNVEGGVKECIYNQNGNHVIQKCIEKAPPFVIKLIMQSFKDNIVDLSQHVYGCRVVQKLIQQCDEKMKIQIIEQILPATKMLSHNVFGNYVIQYILENGGKGIQRSIISIVQDFFEELSQDKYGSNVVEKSFINGNYEEREKFISLVLNDNSPNPPVINMMKDQYGNYVIQKIIEEANRLQLTRIIKKIRSFGLDLSQLPFGKYTLARIDQLQSEKLEESMLPN